MDTISRDPNETLTPAERVARTPIASAWASMTTADLSAGQAADLILAAIRDAGLEVVDPDERCGECDAIRSAHGEWSADLSHTFGG